MSSGAVVRHQHRLTPERMQHRHEVQWVIEGIVHIQCQRNSTSGIQEGNMYIGIVDRMHNPYAKHSSRNETMS